MSCIPDFDLVEINKTIETQKGDPDLISSLCGPQLWHKWLWYTDPTVELSKNQLLNQMHLVGLILARADAITTIAPVGEIHRVLAHPNAFVHKTPIDIMTLHELHDTVTNLQVEWNALFKSENTHMLIKVVRSCFGRFGALALTELGVSELNSNELVDLCSTRDEDGEPMRRLSLSCIRFFTAFFFTAFRHLFVAMHAETLSDEDPEIVLERHLVSSASETFYDLSMYWDLNIGNVLHYRHEFSNMYHSISQVVYYNNTSYERRRQLPLEEIQAGKSKINTLSLVRQLFPNEPFLKEDSDIPREFADVLCGMKEVEETEDEDPKNPKNITKLAIMMFPGSMYIIDTLGSIYTSKHIWPLLNLIIRKDREIKEAKEMKTRTREPVESMEPTEPTEPTEPED